MVNYTRTWQAFLSWSSLHCRGDDWICFTLCLCIVEAWCSSLACVVCRTVVLVGSVGKAVELSKLLDQKSSVINQTGWRYNCPSMQMDIICVRQRLLHISKLSCLAPFCRLHLIYVLLEHSVSLLICRQNVVVVGCLVPRTAKSNTNRLTIKLSFLVNNLEGTGSVQSYQWAENTNATDFEVVLDAGVDLVNLV